jgi:hypothetical protein
MTGPLGVWVVYDGLFENAAAVRVFRSEIAALRYALGNTMKVLFVKWGDSLDEADTASLESS